MSPALFTRLRLPLAWVVVLGLGFSCGQQPSFEDNSSIRKKGGGEALPIEGDDDDADGDGGDDAKGGGRDGGADGDGDDAGSGADDGDGEADGDDDPAVIERLKRLPKFGLLVNDLECGLCHVTVVGDVVSSRRVPPLWPGSHAHVTGRWLAADQFDAATPNCAPTDPVCRGANVYVAATGGVAAPYRGPELPLDRDGDGAPDFPALAFDQLAAKMRGAVATGTSFANKVHQGPLVLVGTQADPIRLEGDVLVEGDLVIKGWYTGRGSLYVRGNVYVPGDLRAMRTAFPFSDDDQEALAKAQDLASRGDTDALGIATPGSIFLGDLEKQQTSDAGNETVTVYNHSLTPANRQGPALGVYGVYGWLPGGKAAYDALYDDAVSCLTNLPTQRGSFNMIEAFLYAQNTIAGISRRASYTIRGGVIADYFHVVSGAAHCADQPSPVHGRPANRSYVEYDHRLRTGKLRVLEHVAEHFPAEMP